MGIALIKALATHPTLELVAAGIRPGTAALTRSNFEYAGVSFANDLLVEQTAQLFTTADAVIDFSAPEHAVGLAGLAAMHKKILVSGTTGLNSAQKEALIRAGEQTRVVWSANMSVGVNLLMALTERAAHLLPEADIEILEMHHRHKVDAPSGTALALGDAAAQGRGVNLHDVWVKSRDGHTGARKPGEIGFATLRGRPRSNTRHLTVGDGDSRVRKKAVEMLRGKCPVAAVTRSEKGSVVIKGSETYAVPAAPVPKVVDTTGAGDLYAAGFLFGFTQNKPLAECARLGGIAAAEVISHVGARPERALRSLI